MVPLFTVPLYTFFTGLTYTAFLCYFHFIQMFLAKLSKSNFFRICSLCSIVKWFWNLVTDLVTQHFCCKRLHFLDFCSVRVFFISVVNSFQFSASSLNLEAMGVLTSEWKHPHLSRKASCPAPYYSLAENLTHSAASHCDSCTSGTVPC